MMISCAGLRTGAVAFGAVSGARGLAHGHAGADRLLQQPGPDGHRSAAGGARHSVPSGGASHYLVSVTEKGWCSNGRQGAGAAGRRPAALHRAPQPRETRDPDHDRPRALLERRVQGARSDGIALGFCLVLCGGQASGHRWRSWRRWRTCPWFWQVVRPSPVG
eukprot:2984879-Rhodomonas_salina.1